MGADVTPKAFVFGSQDQVDTGAGRGRAPVGHRLTTDLFAANNAPRLPPRNGLTALPGLAQHPGRCRDASITGRIGRI